MSQTARVPMIEGMRSTTTTNTLTSPIAAPMPSVRATTPHSGSDVLRKSHAQQTLVSEMLPPIEASMAPDAIGTRTASAAMPERALRFSTSRIVLTVGNTSGVHKEKATIMIAHT